MIYTHNWVKEKYTYYNNFLFGNKLPDFSNVRFEITNDRNTFGRGGCSRWEKIQTNSYPYYTYKAGYPAILKLSNYYDAPEDVKINVLVHEMVHIYEMYCEPQYVVKAIITQKFSRNTYPKDGHGYVFYKMGEMINEKCGINITRFVTKEQLESVSYSEDQKGKMQRRANKGLLFLIMKYKTPFYKGGKLFDYGVARVREADYDEWKQYISKGSYYKTNMSEVYSCVSFDINGNMITARKPGRWSVYSSEDFENLKEKLDFKFKEQLIGERNEEDKIEVETQDERFNFRMPLRSGKVFEVKNATKDEIRKALEEKFPHFQQSIIDKLLNDQTFYTKMKKNINESRLRSIIREVIEETIGESEIPSFDSMPDELEGTIVDN